MPKLDKNIIILTRDEFEQVPNYKGNFKDMSIFKYAMKRVFKYYGNINDFKIDVIDPLNINEERLNNDNDYAEDIIKMRRLKNSVKIVFIRL
jgi:hypothetical protein